MSPPSRPHWTTSTAAGLEPGRVEPRAEHTLATASYVLGEPDATIECLRELQKRRREQRDVKSIKAGLRRLVECGEVSSDLLDTCWSGDFDDQGILRAPRRRAA